MIMYYMAVTDDGSVYFYEHDKEGLIRMASLFDDKTCKFYEITVHNEFVLTYGKKIVPMDNEALIDKEE